LKIRTRAHEHTRQQGSMRCRCCDSPGHRSPSPWSPEFRYGGCVGTTWRRPDPGARELSSNRPTPQPRRTRTMLYCTTHPGGLVVGHGLLLERDTAVEGVHQTHGVELDLHVLRRVNVCTARRISHPSIQERPWRKPRSASVLGMPVWREPRLPGTWPRGGCWACGRTRS
jgi:hypothetical protein